MGVPCVKKGGQETKPSESSWASLCRYLSKKQKKTRGIRQRSALNKMNTHETTQKKD